MVLYFSCLSINCGNKARIIISVLLVFFLILVVKHYSIFMDLNFKLLCLYELGGIVCLLLDINI